MLYINLVVSRMGRILLYVVTKILKSSYAVNDRFAEFVEGVAASNDGV